jgi:hypothetical protein
MRQAVTPQAIVEAVAERKGVPSLRLQPRLYDAVDTDALETILDGASSGSNTPVEVRFEYAGYSVTVRSDGTLAVD